MIFMKTFSSRIEKTTSLITKLLLLITPLFFLPVTREFVVISKLYLFIYAVVMLLILSLVTLIVQKKIVWSKNVMTNGLFLFIIAAALSVVIMSPNKMQALFLPYFGFITILAMGIYYLYLSKAARENSKSILYYLSASGFIAGIISIVFFVQPFRALELPSNLTFLQNPLFNTVGSQFDFIIFLAFSITSMILYFVESRKASDTEKNKKPVIFYVFFTTVVIALAIQLYQVISAVFIAGNGVILPPFSTSWFAAIEILKNLQTALFGVGIGNFASVFTQVKDVSYNATDLWQISSFNVSRSVFFHILTELGVLGAIGIGFVLFTIAKYLKEVPTKAKVLIGFSLVTFLLFPPSFIVWFMFFVALAYYVAFIPENKESMYEVNLQKIIPLFISSVLVFAVFIIGIVYFTSVTFASEVIFKNALDAITNNDVEKLYEQQQRAIILNPYNEDFRKSFSQTNLIIANNIAAQDPAEISDADRETITQAIQAAIAESKAAVTLNPQKVSNWQYLASIYRNIINVAQGADVWTVASYQRAILLDPQNPVYRLELGGVYFLLEAYDDAQRLFEQAVTLKPDWANAHYNLAWTYYRQENYAAAVRQMEQVLTLLDREEAKADFEQAQKDLEEFRNALPTQEVVPAQEASPSAEVQDGDSNPELLLPTPPEASLESQIELPEEASPEAEFNGFSR